MIPTPNFFRRLLFLSILMGIISVAINVAFPSLVPDILRNAEAEYLENLIEPLSMSLVIGSLFSLCGLLAGIFISYGLFTFKPWARPFNLGFAFSSFIVWPILGYNLSSGWAQPFVDIADMLWGAVTVLTFVPPISEKFDRANPPVKRGAP